MDGWMNSEASHSWQKANITLFSVGSGLDGLKCLAETPTRRFLSPQTEKNKAPHFFFFFSNSQVSSLVLRMCWIMITVSSIRFLRYLLRFCFIERYWIFLKQAAHMKTLYPGNRSSEGGFKMQDLGKFTGNRVYLEFALPLATAGTWFKSQLHRWCLWPQVTSSLWADVLSNSILRAPRSAEREALIPSRLSKISGLALIGHI